MTLSTHVSRNSSPTKTSELGVKNNSSTGYACTKGTVLCGLIMADRTRCW